MAKGNMLLGQARGSVGDVVFSVENGEQISKVRARTHANPKTKPQQIQRAIMATVAQAWVVLGPIVKSMWQGYKKESEAKFKFTSVNVSRLRSMYAADEQRIDNLGRNRCHCVAADSNYAVGNEYQIAQGTLTNNQFKYGYVNKQASLTLPTPRDGDTVKRYGNRLKLVKSDRYTIVMLYQTSELTYAYLDDVDNKFGCCYRWRAGFITLKPREDYKKNTNVMETFGDLFEISESYNVDSEIEDWLIDTPINAHALSARGLASAASVGLAKWRYRSSKRAPGWLWLDYDAEVDHNQYVPFGLVHPYITKAWSPTPTNVIKPLSPSPSPTPPTPTQRKAYTRQIGNTVFAVNEEGHLLCINYNEYDFLTYNEGNWLRVSLIDPSYIIEQAGGYERISFQGTFDVDLVSATMILPAKDDMVSQTYTYSDNIWTPNIETWQQ